MRTKSTILNSLFSFGSAILLAIMSLILRKIFTHNLSIEYLGYEGLFTNIFTLLSLAELGFETIVMYRLMEAFGNNKLSEFAYFINIYRVIYEIVGLVVLVIGILLIPFLKVIITDNSLNWNDIYIIYFIQLSTVLCSYLLAYKRIVYVVAQQQYKIIKIDFPVGVVSFIIRLLSIILLKSYFIYLLVSLVQNIVSNIIVSIKTDKDFHYIFEKKRVSISELKDTGILKDLKNVMVSKFAGVIYGGTDNIVVSIFLGITNVALLGNYQLIVNYIQIFVNSILYPFQASIGDLLNKDYEKGQKMFEMFDLIMFAIASIIALCTYSVLNRFIILWLGEDYVFSKGFVILFALNLYIGLNQQFLLYYRNTFGSYDIDKWFIVLGALVNVVVSVFLARVLGIVGIILGTLIGNVGFWFGRARAVFQVCLKESLLKYFVRQMYQIILVLFEIVIIYKMNNMIFGGIGGFVISLLIGILIPIIISILVIMLSKERYLVMKYLVQIFHFNFKDI